MNASHEFIRRMTSSNRRTILVLLIALCWPCYGANAASTDSELQPQPTQLAGSAQTPADQVLVVSTRNYPNVTGQTLDIDVLQGCVVRCDGRCGGEHVTLIGDEPYAETWIFVHGNQVPAKTAIERGLRVYRSVRPYAPVQGPIRFIIWSWPSDKEKCCIVDARVKARRTDAEAFYLGSYLAKAASESHIKLIAYSFGARIAAGGLHLAAGGVLCGRYLPERETPVAPIPVILIAGAVESDGFQPGGRFQLGLQHVDRMLLLNNSSDAPLRFFWVINNRRPKSLGSVGIKCNPGDTAIVQYDWSKAIGKNHSIWQYLDRPIIRQRIGETISQVSPVH